MTHRSQGEREARGGSQGRRRSWVGAACLVITIPAIGLQWMPGPVRTNPPVVFEQTIEANLRMTPAVSGLIRRSCADCHSNETRWPWYARIAPMSWLVASDVNKARAAMNFSEWTKGPGRKAGTAIGALAAACVNVESGRMPLPKYLRLHPEARLTPEARQMFCDWTQTEIARLAVRKARPATTTAQVRYR